MVKRTAAYGIYIILMIMMLTGCQDAIELENRGFAGAVSIDKNKDNPDKPFLVGVELMTLNDGTGKDKGEESGGRHAARQEGEAFTAAMRELNTHFSKSLYFGLTKACVIGEELMKDEALLREAADGLLRNGEISRKLIILAVSGEAADMLSKEIRGENSLGFFTSKFYRNNENFAASSVMLDLEGFTNALRDNGCAVIPKLEYDEDTKELTFSGAAVIAERKLGGYITDKEIKGLLWIKGKARGAEVVCDMNGANVPLKVDKSTVKINFNESGEGLTCVAVVHARGVVEEYVPWGEAANDETVALLEQNFAEAISGEIMLAWDVFKKHSADGFGLSEILRKRYPGLYEKYGSILAEDIGSVNFSPDVSVRVTNMGTVK